MGLISFEDVLNYFPYRYVDKSEVSQIAQLNISAEWVQLAGVIQEFWEEGAGRSKRLKATFKDASGSIELIWFQGITYLVKSLSIGTPYLLYGKASWFNGSMSISHPELEILKNDLPQLGLQPLYPSTERLRTRGITNRNFSKITQSLFEKINLGTLVEFLPVKLRNRYRLISLEKAYKQIHFPKNVAEVDEAKHRLKWEELFLLQLKIAKLMSQHRAQPGYIMSHVGDAFNNFYTNHLAFELTDAQKRVVKEISKDLASGLQMNRLLQGDVGSGKTIVALLIMLIAIDNGFQACIMAPTEILSRQHFETFKELLQHTNIKVAILTGTVKGAARKETLAGLHDGSIQIAIGTHALIEDTVQFRNLGLAIIDEQHRFGVGQRERLWQKNQLHPHILVMTATPIPRTLAMTLYGDLEVSVIDELPPGRKEITTTARADTQRYRIIDFLKEEIKKGRQVYIVYPLIEESEKLDYENIEKGYEEVKAFFQEDTYKIAMVHGRMKPEEKERNRQRFVSGEAHILIATTVIEVGVNVPNASVMVIESAERFGLAQLHQLRGRVGRGAEKSYCILLHGQKISEESKHRLALLCQTQNGFVLAEEDLKLRGPGDLYGKQQSGELKLKIANLVEDLPLLEEAREAAMMILQADPELQHYPLLKQALQQVSSNAKWRKVS